MSNKPDADTVVFRVIDPDTSLTEHFTVTIRQLNVVETGRLDAGRIVSVILDPRKTSAERDTVQVTVEDRAGHGASESIEIFYGADRY